jgi:hypothetical protein
MNSDGNLKSTQLRKLLKLLKSSLMESLIIFGQESTCQRPIFLFINTLVPGPAATHQVAGRHRWPSLLGATVSPATMVTCATIISMRGCHQKTPAPFSPHAHRLPLLHSPLLAPLLSASLKHDAIDHHHLSPTTASYHVNVLE